MRKTKTGAWGNWKTGTISIPVKDGGRITAKYEVKCYDVGSQYGINGGKISKLRITIDDRTVANYDRGWDIEPKTEEEKICLCILLNDYN